MTNLQSLNQRRWVGRQKWLRTRDCNISEESSVKFYILLCNNVLEMYSHI